MILFSYAKTSKITYVFSQTIMFLADKLKVKELFQHCEKGASFLEAFYLNENSEKNAQ